MTADSGSTRRANATVKSPDEIHVKTRWTIARASGSSAASRHTTTAETRNDPSIAAQATAPAAALLRRRPKLAFTRKPMNGSSGISKSIRCLPFECREGVGVQRFLVPEQRDDDCESNGRLRRGDGHDEKHDDLSVRRAQRTAEGDERQVHRVQHDLDRQENRDEIPAHEYAGRADREQNRRQQQVVAECGHQRGPSRRARTTAPTIATRMRIDVTSNGNA